VPLRSYSPLTYEIIKCFDVVVEHIGRIAGLGLESKIDGGVIVRD
jgi:hypothetical protein